MHPLILVSGAGLVAGAMNAQIGRRAPAGVIRAATLVLTFCITRGFFVRTYAPALLH